MSNSDKHVRTLEGGIKLILKLLLLSKSTQLAVYSRSLKSDHVVYNFSKCSDTAQTPSYSGKYFIFFLMRFWIAAKVSAIQCDSTYTA